MAQPELLFRLVPTPQGARHLARRLHFIYCIECNTPNYLYVGQTANLILRLCNHVDGKGHQFTAEHGVKQWCIVNTAWDRKTALELEEQEYLRLTCKGFIVGGCLVYNRKHNKVEPVLISKTNHDTTSAIQSVMDNITLKTLRDKARALAIMINKHPEAAMSILRRTLGRIR